jgi:hypothetical protein
MVTGAVNDALVKLQAKWLDLVVTCGVEGRRGYRGQEGYRGQPA